MPDSTPQPLDRLAGRGRDDAPALVLRERTLTHAELRKRVGLLAGWLAGRVPAGARVASWAAKGELTCLLPLAALDPTTMAIFPAAAPGWKDADRRRHIRLD